MFTGHFAVALAAAGSARRLPLALLIAAAFCGDLTEAVVAAVNVPDPTRVWSHSLPATAAAGALLALGWRATGGSWREAGLLLLVSASHTALDFVTAYKSIWPGVRPMGLLLYQRPILDAVVEVALCVVGWIVWRSSLPAARRSSTDVRAMLVVLIVAQAVLGTIYVKFGALLDSSGMSKFVK